MSDVPVHEGFFVRLFSHLYRVFGSRGKYICFDLNPYFGTGNGGGCLKDGLPGVSCAVP